MQYRKGFTIIEILIVVGIGAMVAGLSVSAFSGVRNYFALRAAVQDVQTALLGARARALASSNAKVHGVHIEAGKVVQFEGLTYATSTASNITFVFPSGVTATSSLSGGVTDILFARLTGLAQATGTILLQEVRSQATTTVTLYASGAVEI